jgi:hypothetical protein
MPALSERGLRSGEWCSPVEQSRSEACPTWRRSGRGGFAMIIAVLHLDGGVRHASTTDEPAVTNDKMNMRTI